MSKKRNPPRRYELCSRAPVEAPPRARTMAAGAGGPFTPMAQLDELINCGWGDTPQDRIPRLWRSVRPKEDDPRAP
jgi:hypothetical protein